MSSGLTNYFMKDPFGHLIDLSYVLIGLTGATGPTIKSNFKSNGVDIGRYFQPNGVQILDSSGNNIIPFPVYDASFAYYEFTRSTSLSCINCDNVQLSYLAIGGGGGGGRGGLSTYGGGGGGGGGITTGFLKLNQTDTVTIVVGTGGTGPTSGSVPGVNGGATTISTLGGTNIYVAGGGGGGAVNSGKGQDSTGSSTGAIFLGGGGGSSNSGDAGIGKYNGGIGNQKSGGGGGGGSIGGDSNPGNGGTGLSPTNATLPTQFGPSYLNKFYCGGGGGGDNGNGNNAGAGGYNSGGAGGNSNSTGNPGSMYGGGGGGGTPGARGGDGYQGGVILAYPIF